MAKYIDNSYYFGKLNDMFFDSLISSQGFLPRKFYFLSNSSSMKKFYQLMFVKELVVFQVFSFLFTDFYRFSSVKYLFFLEVFNKLVVVFKRLKFKGLGYKMSSVSKGFLQVFCGLNNFFYLHKLDKIVIKSRGRHVLILGFSLMLVNFIVKIFVRFLKKNDYKKSTVFFDNTSVKFYKKKLIH